tara:strand:+ start:523 stop:624 length:102 start_codon:yes stop_codon:yes gene_type:complete
MDYYEEVDFLEKNIPIPIAKNTISGIYLYGRIS